ncbi:methyltransferase domain-containing protein [Phenylobacterium sp.]|uniref:methyltransferase domain-containing protein n=1 Tax=Phenylobacterium sp. TaxID=1871053 RepID=UPI002C04AE86|nr:methyltransferase domain-containing protein [Phenylobacterium sp.]HVI31283.1 methyltransferase domain-containing protein [Phenylobacterium sp.]
MARAPGSEKRPGWHWSDYWRGGRAEVMTVEGPAGPAPLDIGDLWPGFFRELPDGARVLDLATGGGQVARIAWDTARAAGRRLEVVGVDYADLPPPGGDGPVLMGGVSLEKLPFDAASFDAATSQYGIEYAEPRAALAELARVLRPAGRALILAHHAASAITASAAAQLDAFDRTMGGGEALRRARRLFAAIQERRKPEVTQVAHAALREAVSRASARLPVAPEAEFARYMVHYLADLSQRAGAYEPGSALRRLDEVEAGNAAWRQRRRNQLTGALDARGADEFLHRAGRAGLSTVERAEAHDANGVLIGWRFLLQRA